MGEFLLRYIDVRRWRLLVTGDHRRWTKPQVLRSLRSLPHLLRALPTHPGLSAEHQLPAAAGGVAG